MAQYSISSLTSSRRGGFTFAGEVALGHQDHIRRGARQRHRAVAQERPCPGASGIDQAVLGLLVEDQFAEKRLPTPAELDAAAPDHPVYVQHLYQEAIINKAGMGLLAIKTAKDLPGRGGKLDMAGEVPTGVIRGNISVLGQLHAKLPAPSFQGQVNGTRDFMRELKWLGMTGLVDGGGNGQMFDKHYKPLQKLWQDKQLTMRLRYRVMPQLFQRGKELEVLKAYAQTLKQGAGDDMLRFIGWGEVIVWGMHDGAGTGRDFKPPEAAKKALGEALKWIAKNGYSMEIHASNDFSANHILDLMQTVNATRPIAPLRWYIVHVDNATPATLDRMKTLGVGYAVQDRLLYDGEPAFLRLGSQRAKVSPPINTALKKAIKDAGGTDAHRVAPYSPMRSLQWFLDGKAISGKQLRDASEIPTRLDALRIYSLNGAYMSFEEKERGSIETGKLADLAVLDKDYLTVPADQVGSIQSLLTLVGGKVVYAAGPYAAQAPN